MMVVIPMTWLGGPKDGDVLAVDERFCHSQIKVVYGLLENPEERYVTPRHMSDGRWILPFYEGKATKETR